MTETVPDPEFLRSVERGLSAKPKRLSSRYFYDAEGDRLFQQIMASPEYYLTDCEYEIFAEQGEALARAVSGGQPVELLELGSGDGLKSQLLLDALHALDVPLVYRPLDISANSLDLLRERIQPSRPWLDLQPIHGDYHDILPALPPLDGRRVMMFLGSNLGNFGNEGAEEFLTLVRSALEPKDRLLIGLDLVKDPAVILAAYNDAAGHTRAFNLNLLTRINRELGADFETDQFEHRPTYNETTGAAESYLVSRVDQRVTIEALGRSFDFEAGEAVFMEVSQKYSPERIAALAGRTGFEVERSFTDRRGWFTDQLWKPVQA